MDRLPRLFSRSESVCRRCKAMCGTRKGLKALTSKDGYEHYTLKELNEHTRKGCLMCCKILSTLRDNHSAFEDDPSNPGWLNFFALNSDLQAPNAPSSVQVINDYTESLKMMRYLDIHGPGPDHHSLFMLCSTDSTVAAALGYPPKSFDMRDGMVAKSARAAMETCCQSHSQCGKYCIPLLPRAVIDVGPDDPRGAIDPKLHISNEAEYANYACLSYCWGGVQQFSTTCATVESNVRSLKFDNLARTIQDAILVTRMLKIRYLWVDALCIVQDDPADKEEQLKSMGLIYKNATLTIAAASAKTVHDGFLNEWSADDDGIVLPFLLPTDNSKGSIEVVKTRNFHASEWPLDYRAWTLQEYLLSPRLLIFGSGGPVWQCQQIHFEPIIPSNKLFRTDLQRLPADVFNAIQLPRSHQSQHEALRIIILSEAERKKQQSIWKSLVENYSARKISYASDRPLAIAGITSELTRIWGHECSSGIWRAHSVLQLCWFTCNENLPIKSQAVPGIPSWSWIGVNSSVRHMELEMNWSEEGVREEARLIYASSTPLTDLVLEVKLLLVDGTYRVFEGSSNFRLLDNWLETKAVPGSYIRDGYLAIFPDFEPSSEERWQFGNGTAYATLGSLGENAVNFGLILLPLTPGRYKRIGLFVTQEYTEDKFSKYSVPKVITIV